MQSISRFLAVLIALIFLIGPLAGTAAAHETEDGDHEDATYGELSLTRLDDLGEIWCMSAKSCSLAVTFTQADAIHYLQPGTTEIDAHGCAWEIADPILTLSVSPVWTDYNLHGS